MKISVRNQLPGTISAITLGGVMAEVVIDLSGDVSVAAAITRGSVEQMSLAIGDQVFAVVKATEILSGKSITS